MGPPIVNSPKSGHSITNVSTKDTTYGPSIIPTMLFEHPKKSLQRPNQLNCAVSEFSYI